MAAGYDEPIEPIKNGLTIATNIAYSKAELKKMFNMSYLFDPTWVSSGDTRVGNSTLPMALLFITKLTEIGQSDISSQQVILYRSNIMDSLVKLGMTPSQAQLNVMADNIVNKPLQYQVEAILPASYVSLINSPFNPGPGNVFSNPAYLATEYSSNGNTLEEKAQDPMYSIQWMLQTGPSLVFDTLKMLIALTSGLIATAGTSAKDVIMNTVKSIINGTSYNKDSLMAMWYNRSILKFKPPMDWNYRTVVMSHFNIDKKPTEDDCYRVSITLQEIPIVTTGFYKKFLFSSAKLKKQNSIIVSGIGKGLKAALELAGTTLGNDIGG